MNYLTELSLSEFFSCTTLLANQIFNREVMLSRLEDIFMVSKEECDMIRYAILSPAVSAIETEQDYFRELRIKQYLYSGEDQRRKSSFEDEVTAIKGSVISALTAIEGLIGKGRTRSETGKILLDHAAAGNVHALRAVGFLLCEGIFFGKDVELGVKYLKRAASWNDVRALIMLMHYDSSSLNKNMNVLRYALNNMSKEDCIIDLEWHYGMPTREDCREAVLLEKLFRLGILKRDSYSSSYSRILFSSVISYKDKEKLLFSSSKEFVAEIGDLPLKLSLDNMCRYDISMLDENMPVKREAELNAVRQSIVNSDMRTSAAYLPLCLSSDSQVMLRMYADAIEKSVGDAHVVRIDVSELGAYDFEPNKNNIFVRSCEDDKENIYFLFFKGEISEKKLELLKTFLKSSNRKAFRLNAPGVSLDLSPVLPICFCDSMNESELRPYCNIVSIGRVLNDEKPAVIKAVLRAKETEYGIPEIIVSEKIKKELCSMTVDEAERRLDEIVRERRRKGEKMVIKEGVERKKRAVSRFGFGGDINADK